MYAVVPLRRSPEGADIPMLKTLQALVACALVLLITSPAGAVGSTGGIVTLTGILNSVHEDSLGIHRETHQYFLTSGGERYVLRFADGGPEGQNGAEVTVTGRLAGHTLAVAGSHGSSFRIRKEGPVSAVTSGTATTGTTSTSGTGTVSPSISAGTTRAASVAAVLVNLTDLNSQPYTTSQVASAVYGATGSVKAFFEEESKGRMTVTGSVFGWYTINATSTNCNWSTWVSLANTAANAAGANLSSFTNVMYIFPYTSQCGFAGLGYVPGTVSVLNGTISVQVMTHELGHNFGLGHANGINCAVNGTRVALSTAANCSEQAYVDPFSTMGNNALRHNQGSQLGELGWLSSSEKVIGAPGHTYAISPYFSSGAVKLVRIPRGDGTYFDLDFRTTYGNVDNFAAGSPAVSGVTIRIGKGTASPTNSPQPTDLIDTTPSTSSWADAPLLVGRTFTDPVSKMSFTTMAITNGAVQVRVRELVAPSAPGAATATAAADGASVALAWGAATDNVAVAGYAISRNGTTVANADAGTLTWTDTAAALGGNYTYSVVAVDTSGNEGPGATATVSMPADPNAVSVPPSADQPPTAPQPLSAAPATTSIRLTWGASSDDHGVSGYVVARNGAAVATITGTTWTDTARIPNTAYTYSVRARDTAGNLSAATSVKATTTRDTIAPTAPKYFHKARQWGRYVTFAWVRSGDNVRVVRYLVYRYGRSTPIAQTSNAWIRIYTTRGMRYYIRAVDAAGNRSAMSGVVRISY